MLVISPNFYKLTKIVLALSANHCIAGGMLLTHSLTPSLTPLTYSLTHPLTPHWLHNAHLSPTHPLTQLHSWLHAAQTDSLTTHSPLTHHSLTTHSLTHSLNCIAGCMLLTLPRLPSELHLQVLALTQY